MGCFRSQNTNRFCKRRPLYQEGVPDCEVLDEARGCWSRLPPMAAARSVFAAAALEGEIYVCGGQGEDGEATASCEKFSPKLGRYTIYTIYNYISSISTIYIYTRWRPLPDMCRPRRGHVAVVLEGVVFVLGGDTDTCEW